jgi:hypothetical protein
MRSRSLALAFLVTLALSGCARQEPAPPPAAVTSPIVYDGKPRLYVAYPEKPDPACRDGKAKIFDECGDQLALFDAARARANAEGKVLLVEYGAEWCIWCHAFAAHIKGEHSHFRYTAGSPDAPDDRDTTTFVEGKWADPKAAQELATFVADNFVLVHIELEYAPNGRAVLEKTGALRHYTNSVPYIYTVDGNGRFAARLNAEGITRRREGLLNWYRGYDRTKLLASLEALRDAAAAVPIQ